MAKQLQDEAERDSEYWRVYIDALKTQHDCEIAGMTGGARLAREIRRQAHIRLVALGAALGSPENDDMSH
jgi:hypothetical protein